MKKSVLILIAVLALSFAGCGKGNAESAEPAEPELSARLAEAAGVEESSVYYLTCGKFSDSTGAEAFAFVGEVPDNIPGAECYGSVWYINDEACIKVLEDRSFSVMENTIFSVMPTGEKTFVSVVETFATDSVSHLLYVEDGLVKSS
ncbi:MAG: hypothetical protein K6B75_03425, partial [Lachnospiraceae bacterium]|nr:hypothetical protein [Lachnospiraceae bacterium]